MFDILFCGHWVVKNGQGILRGKVEDGGNSGRDCVEDDSAGSADTSVLSRFHFLFALVFRWLHSVLLAVRYALSPYQRGVLVLESA